MRSRRRWVSWHTTCQGRSAVDSVVEHEQRERLATIRLISPLSGGVLVDLLFARSGVEAEIVEAAEPLEILPGLMVPVASAAHLVVLKLLARDDDVKPLDPDLSSPPTPSVGGPV